ncbi:type II toxin-antitoxin system ParD family antitoxin [Agrobacterium vitis]|uniref:type II toxin-antitoxin system ParD family antitoxin n=1 Tax=Agrobacterium vitis TaxID=373 RepID=UPI00307E27C8|nr:type II toxin-antitoxin system ParD family antitoxin [Agrobacterium vitis]
MSNLIKAGCYKSCSEFPRKGIRMIEEREKRLAALDIAIARGVADADAGRSKPIHDIGKRLTTKYQKMAEGR